MKKGLSSKLPVTLTDMQLIELATNDPDQFRRVYRAGLAMMKQMLDQGLDPDVGREAFKVLTTPHVEVSSYQPEDAIKQAVEDKKFAESYLPRFHPLYNGTFEKRPEILQKALWVMENVPGLDELLKQYSEQRVQSMSSDPSGAFHIDSRTFNTMLTANRTLQQLHADGWKVRFDLTLGFFNAEAPYPSHLDEELFERPFDRVSGIYYGEPFPDHKYTPTTREVEKRLKEES